MINPNLKNQRTGFHQDVLSLSCHYMRLIKTKPQVDNSWKKSQHPFHSKSKLQKSLDNSRHEDNRRLMNKIFSIERRSGRYQTQDNQRMSSNKRSLKNRYKEYQKELAISEDNIKMMKKIENADSQLSKEKMDRFGKNMKNYSRIAKSSKRNAHTLIDEMFYRNFKLQLIRERTQCSTAHQNKLAKKRNKKHHRDLLQKIQNTYRQKHVSLHTQL